jgi:YVTN family beta-propeller protein
MHFATPISLLCLIAPAARPVPSTGTIVTSNMTTKSASLIDVATGAIVATMPTSTNPHEAAVSNDGRWAVISIYGDQTDVGHSLLVIDVEHGVADRTIELGTLKRPHGVKFLPGDDYLVLTSEVAGRIALVNFAKGTVDTTIETGQAQSHMIAVTPDGKRGFSTNVGAGSVSAFDLAARARTGIFPVGTRVEGIAVTPNGREVWVGGNESKTVYVLDTSSGTVTAKIPGFGMPYRIAITPDGKTAVVTDPGAERIHIVDVARHEVRKTIEVPMQNGSPVSPQGVTIVPDGSAALVTLKAAGQVAIVDLAEGKIVKTLTTGGGSDGVAFSPVVTRRR